MYLICKDNQKFPESGQLRRAAKKLSIKCYNTYFGDAFLSEPRGPFFMYGTRDFVLSEANCVAYSDHIFSKQEYLYDYSFLMSLTEKSRVNLFNPAAVILPASKVGYLLVDELFVRPNSGNKQFSGSIFSAKELKNFLSLVHVDPWELVICALPKEPPVAEYRFFMKRDKEGLDWAACRYLPEPDTYIPPEVIQFADLSAMRIFDFIPFGNSFVLDIAVSSEGDKSVLELNSWNSSSFYCIDPEKILKMVVESCSETTE